MRLKIGVLSDHVGTYIVSGSFPCSELISCTAASGCAIVHARHASYRCKDMKPAGRTRMHAACCNVAGIDKVLHMRRMALALRTRATRY